jgi:NAD-dependent deacetylase
MSSPTRPVPAAVRELVKGARRVTVLTGAGMSAESGVPTFRDAQSGLWARFDAETLATPGAWQADPALVWAWYQWRAQLVRSAAPHPGHLALARLAQLREVRLVTQNVDDLHERAGSSVLAHLHGSLFAPRCSGCGREVPPPPVPEVVPERLDPPACPVCRARVRPGVVWFGEALPLAPLAAATAAHVDTDVVLVVGTSGLIHPAAGLPLEARAHGVPVVEVNPEDTGLTDAVHHVWRARAAEALPALVAAVGD